MLDRFGFEEELSENVRRRFFIGGKWVEPSSAETLPIISPLTENRLLTMPGACPQDVEAAVAAARNAFDNGPWPRMTPHERAAILRRLSEAVAARHGTFARAWTGQVGAPIGFTNMFTGMVPSYYDYYADLAETFAFEDVRPTAQGHARVIREPVGVCAFVLPWNAPLILLSQKLAAGLLSGSTFVVKPSPETPVEALLLAECAQEAGLPAGVLNVIPGGREAGEALVSHGHVDKVSFTGSTVAGKRIGAICADRVARCSLELGGKSAAIICDDADLGATLPALLPVAMPFSGQICFSQTRILVSERRHDDVVAALAAAFEAVPLGDPWDEATQLGPLSMARQHERVLDYIETGKAEGARLVTGGGNGGFNQGYFVEPTLFDGVTTTMRIAREEIFGPVISVLRYRDETEAIRIANDSDFGLSGTVFTTDLARGERIARGVRTGNVSINALQLDPGVPFGGFKQSGVGREAGPEGLSAFLETKAIFSPASVA